MRRPESGADMWALLVVAKRSYERVDNDVRVVRGYLSRAPMNVLLFLGDMTLDGETRQA